MLNNRVDNKIVKGNNLPLSLDFTFTGDFSNNGLLNFTRIEVTLGSESYNSQDNPELFDITNDKLVLYFGIVTDLPVGYYDIKVNGINVDNPQGRCLTVNDRLTVQVLSSC